MCREEYTVMAISVEKQQEITEKRKKQIIDAAMELFDQKGYSNTKITDITGKAGISKGLLYHYFDSKEEIIHAVIERVDKCINECYEVEDAVESLTLFTLRLLSYPYYENYVPPIRVFFTALIRGEIKLEDDINPVREDFGRTYFSKIFKRGQEQGYFRDGDPVIFGDGYWKCLVGCMAIMNVDKNNSEYRPDVESMLSIYRK